MTLPLGRVRAFNLIKKLVKMKRYNVLDYGIIPNTDELLTTKLQKLVDIVSSNKGGEIYFPSGQYVLSTIFLKDNITIHISKNAKILGSLNFNDYAPLEKVNYPLYQDVSHSYFNCALFVGRNVKNISFVGKGIIDMRSVWDEDNVNQIVHRGAKVISLMKCQNIHIERLNVLNATDLAVYFASSKDVVIRDLKLKVYIDGISPDNSKNVLIEKCNIISGDDGVVFKSSYNMNEIDYCDNIIVRNCFISSRCNAIKFGTESNGGFKNISIENINIKNTRLTGISIESVDGAIIDNININNVTMKNVNAPLFIMLGKRLRGPLGSKIGEIKNVNISNIHAAGPYIPYKTIPWNYQSFIDNDVIQYPWNNDGLKDQETLNILKNNPWQFTSNICGLSNHPLKNISLRNIYFKVMGGVSSFNKDVPDDWSGYPEVFVYGKILPAKGIFFRHIDNLDIKDIRIENYKKDARESLVFEDVRFIDKE